MKKYAPTSMFRVIFCPWVSRGMNPGLEDTVRLMYSQSRLLHLIFFVWFNRMMVPL